MAVTREKSDGAAAIRRLTFEFPEAELEAHPCAHRGRCARATIAELPRAGGQVLVRDLCGRMDARSRRFRGRSRCCACRASA